MSDPKDRSDEAQPWNEVTTAPLPRAPVPPAAPPRPSPRSADSSSKLEAQTGDSSRKLAEVKRSPEVERMLDDLGYARPRPPVERAETDGDVSAAHAAGPHAVPVAVLTPVPQPPIELSHSLVEEISAPISPKAPSPGIAPPMRAGRHGQTVTVRPRVKVSHAAILGLAVAACMFVAAFGWKLIGLIGARTAAPQASTLPEAPAPVPSPRPMVAPALPTPPAASTIAAAPTVPLSPMPPMPTTLPAPPLSATSAASAALPRRSPAPKGATRAPKAAPSADDVGSIHTDFEVQK